MRQLIEPMKGIFIVSLLLMAKALAFGQQRPSVRVTCIVLDSASRQPVAGAGVFIMDAVTGKAAGSAVAGADGSVSMEVSLPLEAAVSLSVQAMGYRKMILPAKPLPSSGSFGELYLAPVPGMLKTVTVKGKPQIARFDGNKMLLSPDQVPNMKFLTTSQLLGQMPFLQIDEGQNSVQMMGETVTVLINGKPHPFYNNPRNLDNIPPQAIERMEVTLIGTGRYAGKVLNVILKKNYFLGWTGSFNTGGTIYGANAGGSASYWSRKAGADVSVKYGYGNGRGRGNSELVSSGDTTLQDFRKGGESHSASIFASAFYKLDSLNTLDFSWGWSPPFRAGFHHETDIVKTSAAGVKEREFGNSRSGSKNNNHSINLNYTKDFKDPDKQFFVLSQYGIGKTLSHTAFSQTGADGALLYGQWSDAENQSKDATLELFFKNKWKNAISYNLGGKWIRRWYDNASGLETRGRTASGSDTLLVSRFNQSVMSVFADGEGKLKKFVLHAGMRLDHQADRYLSPLDYRSSYFKLVPNASVTYNASPASIFLFSYSFNVSRPAFSVMNPVLIVKDAVVRDSGNATLRPQYTHSAGLQYYGNHQYGNLGLSLNYSHIRNNVDFSYYIPGPGGTLINNSQNIRRTQTLTLGLNLNLTIGKKVRISHFSSGSLSNIKNDQLGYTAITGYLNDRVSYFIDKKQAVYVSATGYTANVNIQGRAWTYLRFGATYSRFLELFPVKYPAQISATISNPWYPNGLPGYSRQSGPGFYYYTASWSANPLVSLGLNITFKGAANKAKPFNKSKAIFNDDLTSPVK